MCVCVCVDVVMDYVVVGYLMMEHLSLICKTCVQFAINVRSMCVIVEEANFMHIMQSVNLSFCFGVSSMDEDNGDKFNSLHLMGLK